MFFEASSIRCGIIKLISQDTIAIFQEKLSLYLAKVAGTAPSVDYLYWWKNNADSLPNWALCARKILCVQPSSEAAERLFSIINSSFDNQQENALQDYIEAAI